MKITKTFIVAALALGSWFAADACSRVVYIGEKNITLVGRTLDWRTPIPTNIYVYPQGVAKTSTNAEPCFNWVSKYGSVVAVGYDGGVTEGMNEAGLAMNGLFCKNSVYTSQPEGGHLPVMSMAMFVSYFLDNFATVAEVDAWLKDNPFVISGQTFDGGTVSLLHWGITDATGETLVMEYVDGKLTTYRGKQYQVLTNDPALNQMEAINAYWENVGGTHALPGTVRSSDRFARASFFIHQVPTDFEYPQALGALNSVMGTVTVPYGYRRLNGIVHLTLQAGNIILVL